jgi:hypothetical protein
MFDIMRLSIMETSLSPRLSIFGVIGKSKKPVIDV